MRFYRGDDFTSVWPRYFFGVHVRTVIMVSAWPVVWYAVAVMIMRDRCIMLSRSVVCYSVTVMVVGDMDMFVFARGE